MPSTFSPALRLELIGNGEQAANWGNTTNTNLGTLLEQAITGVGNITMLDANYTLVSASGISDEARNAVLVVAGTLTATRSLIVPTSNKFYAVRNATTGGQSILVRTSAGTGVTLANGFTQLMYCDGTNVVLATLPINASTGAVVLNNAILNNPVINGFTGDTALINVGSGQFYKAVGGNIGINTTTPAVKFAINSTDAMLVPVGDDAARPTGAAGYLRFSSTSNTFEGYDGTSWGSIGGGGATGGGTDKAFYLNDTTINNSYTIPDNQNAGTFGPITIASGATVTVGPSSTWTVT